MNWTDNFPKYGAHWRNRVKQNKKVCMVVTRLGNTDFSMNLNLRSVMSRCFVPGVPGFGMASYRRRGTRGQRPATSFLALFLEGKIHGFQ